MSKQYLHLSAYPCDACAGPVIAGSLGVRENGISKETDIRQAGAICLSCGHRQLAATEPVRASQLMPMEWAPADAVTTSRLTSALVDALNLADCVEADCENSKRLELSYLAQTGTCRA